MSVVGVLFSQASRETDESVFVKLKVEDLVGTMCGQLMCGQLMCGQMTYGGGEWA